MSRFHPIDITRSVVVICMMSINGLAVSAKWSFSSDCRSHFPNCTLAYWAEFYLDELSLTTYNQSSKKKKCKYIWALLYCNKIVFLTRSLFCGRKSIFHDKLPVKKRNERDILMVGCLWCYSDSRLWLKHVNRCDCGINFCAKVDNVAFAWSAPESCCFVAQKVNCLCHPSSPRPCWWWVRTW